MALSTRLDLTLVSEQTSTPALGTGLQAIRLAKAIVLASGTGADQADKIYTATGNVNASTTTTLDLAGSLLDVAGAGFTPAKLKGIILDNQAAAQVLTIQRPASNGVPWLTAAGDAIPVPPGIFALLTNIAAGLATVTGSTGDLIDLVNGAGVAVPYRIVLIGTSA